MRINQLLGARLVVVVTGFTSIVLLAGQGAAAGAAPLPAGTTSSHRAPSAGSAGLPDQRRSPGLKALLSEKDSDRAGDPSNMSALCVSELGRPNPYRATGSNVDQIHQDTVVSVGSQAGCRSAQNENTIAVNPENPKNLVAGTNDYRVFNSREQRNDSSGWAYTSFDGGKTWTNVGLPHLTYQTGGTGAFADMDSAGDPVLAFGPHNTVYYGNIVFSRGSPTGSGTEAASGIAVNVSHDGGLHWDEPTLVRVDGVTSTGTPTATRIFNDKIWLAADPRDGRVYVTWTRFLDDAHGGFLESPIVVAASTDYGRTFGGYQRVDAQRAGFSGGLTPYSQGSNPKVGADGTLYIAYEGEQCPTLACVSFRDVTVVATSHDHGRTFTKSVVGKNFDFPFNEPLGTSTITGENFRVNSFPQLAYDPVTKALAVTWSDDRNGRYNAATGASIRSNGDNIVSTSTDGRSWTTPQAIGTGQDEFFGAVAIYDGVLAVTSYTRHYSPGGINLDYAYWSSTVGRHGLGPIRRVTTQGSNPRVQFVGFNDTGDTVQGLFIGDYTGVSLGSDHVLHPCWTDFRGRPGLNTPNQDSYTSAIRI